MPYEGQRRAFPGIQNSVACPDRRTRNPIGLRQSTNIGIPYSEHNLCTYDETKLLNIVLKGGAISEEQRFTNPIFGGIWPLYCKRINSGVKSCSLQFLFLGESAHLQLRFRSDSNESYLAHMSNVSLPFARYLLAAPYASHIKLVKVLNG